MFQGLSDEQLIGALEALLFVSDEPINTITLAEMLEIDATQCTRALLTLKERQESLNSGIQLREVAGRWRLYTHPAFHELIEKYVLSWDTRKLSQAALETLSVIAYNQPITRNGIVSVRGVNSDSSINSLIEKGLVKEAGHENSPGQPILYATTRAFLEKFGLASVADLPRLEDYAPDEESKRLIQERLGVTRSNLVEPGQISLFDQDLDEDETLEFDDEIAADAANDDTMAGLAGALAGGIAESLVADYVREGIDFEHDELTRDMFAQMSATEDASESDDTASDTHA